MPTSKKLFSINSYPKMSDDLFYAFIPIFTFIPSFLNFFTDESPPYPRRPGPFLTIYPYFCIFTYTFFRKLPRWMPPWLDALGRRTHPHPPSQATAHNRSSGRLKIVSAFVIETCKTRTTASALSSCAIDVYNIELNCTEHSLSNIDSP